MSLPKRSSEVALKQSSDFVLGSAATLMNIRKMRTMHLSIRGESWSSDFHQRVAMSKENEAAAPTIVTAALCLEAEFAGILRFQRASITGGRAGHSQSHGQAYHCQESGYMPPGMPSLAVELIRIAKAATYLLYVAICDRDLLV